MHSLGFLYFMCILVGFGLIRAPIDILSSSLVPLTNLIGILAILFFSIALLYEGIKAFFRFS